MVRALVLKVVPKAALPVVESIVPTRRLPSNQQVRCCVDAALCCATPRTASMMQLRLGHASRLPRAAPRSRAQHLLARAHRCSAWHHGLASSAWARSGWCRCARSFVGSALRRARLLALRVAFARCERASSLPHGSASTLLDAACVFTRRVRVCLLTAVRVGKEAAHGQRVRAPALVFTCTKLP